MKPTTEILANMSRNSSAHHDEVFTRVYRYLLRPDLYFAAYKRLQANNGADTRGVNDDTADGFSERKINCIIEALKNGSYEPLPVRGKRIVRPRSVLWDFRHSRISWFRMSCGWCWKQSTNLFFPTSHMDFVPTAAVILRFGKQNTVFAE